LYENALPVLRWHIAQAQACTLRGGADTVTVNAPQAQDAVFG
jgi:hypothetical protein